MNEGDYQHRDPFSLDLPIAECSGDDPIVDMVTLHHEGRHWRKS